MGRTNPLYRFVRVNSIDVEKADCSSPQLSYKADIDFFLFDGTSFNPDDAYKDDFFKFLDLVDSSGTDLFNSYVNPSENTIDPELINNLVKLGPAVGAGWDLQQFGYAKPHYNLAKVEDTIQGFIPNPDYDPNCDDDDDETPTSRPLDETNTGVFVSSDPNDILGPEGFGEQRWIDAKKPLDYTIRFENDPKLASAPAQVVRITQQLDSDLDFRTFRVGDFGFGETLIDVPDNRAFYQTRLDLVAERGIYVDVYAGIDIAKGEVFWELRSIDPATGEQPSDPLLGFLPPNLTKPEGDGFVTYTIKPDRNLATGTVIDAEATIVFDINEPIDTPAILNTIDAGKPTSTVNALPQISESPEFTVSWTGSDDEKGSAIADYTIYVAKDGGEYSPWVANTTLTEATFTGKTGSSYEFYAVARDNAGNIQDLTTTAQAVIAIARENNPPVLVNPIGTQTAAEDSNFSLTITENNFLDNDKEEVLTYAATLADGSDLPNWLTFDVDTRTFSGTPTNEDLGNVNIIVTVIDKEGETVSDTFELKVVNTNDAPTLTTAIANQTATEDQSFSFTFAEDTFKDVDKGDSLSYTAKLSNGDELPSWLAFNAETRIFSGTPVNENVDNLSIQLTATDKDGEAATDTFELKVMNTNDAPTLKKAIRNQTATEDQSFSYTFPSNTFNDVDAGDRLAYSASLADGSVLPSWLTFNAKTRTLSGIPVNENVGNLSLRVTATDKAGESANSNFNLRIVNVNDSPLDINLSNSLINENSKTGKVIGNLSTLDPDLGDTHTYSLINDADGRFILDGKKLLVAANNRLDFETNRNHLIEVKTTDKAGLSVTKNLTINVNDLNERPILTSDTFTSNNSNAKVVTQSYLLSNDKDPENQPLNLIGVSNVTGGTVTSEQDTVIFTPTSNFRGAAYFKYTASDGVNNSTATVRVEVGVTQKGTNRNNTWIGTKGDDVYQGLNGNDVITGEGGDDTLYNQILKKLNIVDSNSN
jgi:hypothetical protein